MHYGDYRTVEVLREENKRLRGKEMLNVGND